MSCQRRFVEEELRDGEIWHRLACGHVRRPLFFMGAEPDGIPRIWQHCPTCYREHKAGAAPPVSVIRVKPEDAHWLAGLLGALVSRGKLEYPDAARRVAIAARFAADNPTKEVTRG